MSINYENIKAGIAVIKDFKKKLDLLCEVYQRELDCACHGNTSRDIAELAERYIEIELSSSDPQNGFTLEDIINGGFEPSYKGRTATYYKRDIDGITVVCKYDGIEEDKDV